MTSREILTNIVLFVVFLSGCFRSLRTVLQSIISILHSPVDFSFPLEPPPSIPRSIGLFPHELSESFLTYYVYCKSGTLGHKLCIFPKSPTSSHISHNTCLFSTKSSYQSNFLSGRVSVLDESKHNCYILGSIINDYNCIITATSTYTCFGPSIITKLQQQ